MRKKHWRLILLALIMLPIAACNFGVAPTPIAPTLGAPLLSVNPVSGAPGTLVTLEAVGFPANTSVNLFITAGLTQGSPYAAVNTDAGGHVITTLTLPAQVGGSTLAGGTPITFTLTTTSGRLSANALFQVSSGSGNGSANGTPSAPISGSTAVPNAQTGPTSGVYITEPTNTTITGSIVTVSGSAPAGQVIVQVQDASNNIIGSANVTSVAGVGQALGTWTTTIAFNVPGGAASNSSGYIVALADGQQASIPVTFIGVPAAIPSLVIGPATSAQ